MSDVDVIKSIGEKLRSARRARNQSLEEIAGITRINKKFLEDIEEGITPDLPSAYIRAFIRDYAIEVGISPSDLLEEYLALSAKGAEDTSRRSTTFLNSQFKPTVLDEKIGTTPTKHLPILLILISVIAIGLMVSFFWLRNNRPVSTVQEISFSDVIKEQELKTGLKTAIGDSATTGMKISPEVGVPDTLLLEGVTSESVWVRIIIDGISTNEYMFPPFYRKQWKAKHYFQISLGNGAVVSFTLNGQKLGTLSPVRRSLKNVQITWDTFKKFKKS